MSLTYRATFIVEGLREKKVDCEFLPRIGDKVLVDNEHYQVIEILHDLDFMTSRDDASWGSHRSFPLVYLKSYKDTLDLLLKRDR